MNKCGYIFVMVIVLSILIYSVFAQEDDYTKTTFEPLSSEELQLSSQHLMEANGHKILQNPKNIHKNKAIIVLKSNNMDDLMSIKKLIKSNYGEIKHVIPPDIIVANISTEFFNLMVNDERIDSINFDKVPEKDLTRKGKQTKAILKAWNDNLFESPPDEPTPVNITGFEKAEPKPIISKAALGPSPAGYYDTSEYLIGDVAVGIVMIEGPTNKWTTTMENNVVSEIMTGLNWLAGQEPKARVSWTYDIKYRVPVSIEPTSTDSESLWRDEALQYLGYSSGFTGVYEYINDIRNQFDTDWAYTFFIVTGASTFPSGYFAYAYINGPEVVMTYNNDGWGISNMDKVATHETGHIFGAGDMYCQPGYSCCACSSTYGYLNIQNWQCEAGCVSGYEDGCTSCNTDSCLMKHNDWVTCTTMAQMLGWVDNDGDSSLKPEDCNDYNSTLLTPWDGMYLTRNATLCKGSYELDNGISIGANSLTLNCNNATLAGSYSGNGIYLNLKSNVTIENCELSKYLTAIYTVSSIDNSIIDNKIISNSQGIILYRSNTSNISNNQLIQNQFGLGLFYSGDNLISNNFIFNSSGITLGSNMELPGSSNNLIFNNKIIHGSGIGLSDIAEFNKIYNNSILNSTGLYGVLLYAKNNEIYYNTIEYGEYYGIESGWVSEGNLVHHNNIFGNKMWDIIQHDSNNLSAENNYWGTKNETLIQEKIYDCNDNPSYGCVDYDPWLCASYPEGTTSPCYDCALRIYKGENISQEDFEEVKVWCDDFINIFPQKGPMYPQSERVVLHYLDKCSYPELMDCCTSVQATTIGDEWMKGFCNDDIPLQCAYRWITENCTSITATENCTDGIDNDNDNLIDLEDPDCYQYRSVNLTQGWNLVASPYYHVTNATSALASIEGCYKGIYSFATGIWGMIIPGNPFNNIDVIRPDRGYWIKINCTEINWTTT